MPGSFVRAVGRTETSQLPVKSPTVDLPRLVVASVGAAFMSLGLALALLRYAQSTPDLGPTAAALDEGLSVALGAALGLVIGAALGAMLVRRGSRVVAGALAGFVAYVGAVAPVFIFTGPSDVTLGEMLGTAAYLLIPVVPLVIAGALFGAWIAMLMHRDLQQRPQTRA